jgi:hypothetical protein
MRAIVYDRSLLLVRSEDAFRYAGGSGGKVLLSIGAEDRSDV